MRRKPSNGHTCRAVSGVIRYGLVALAASANVSAQDRPQGCPVELREVRAASRAIANEPLRRELVRMAEARPQDAVRAAGGIDAYAKRLREHIARLDAPAGAAGRSDAERGEKVIEGLLRAARCIIPESDPRQPLRREGAAQISLSLSGAFWPTSLPLFHGSRRLRVVVASIVISFRRTRRRTVRRRHCARADTPIGRNVHL
jgi:hypothetical protein